MRIRREMVVFDTADIEGEVHADPSGHPFCLCWESA